MRVKDVPRCNNFITDKKKAGNTACCLKIAGWGIRLANGKTWHTCISCLTTRLAITGDAIDTASIVFYVKD